MLPKMYTPYEIASYLKKSRNLIYRCIRAGTLPACKLERTYRIREDVLEDFINKLSHQALQKDGTFRE